VVEQEGKGNTFIVISLEDMALGGRCGGVEVDIVAALRYLAYHQGL
jgi:hypothetical protein